MKKIMYHLLFFVGTFYISSQEIDYTIFKGKDVIINHTSKIDKPYILDYEFYPSRDIDSLIYKPNLMGPLEIILYEKHKIFLEKNPENEILMKYKITYSFNEGIASILKYSLLSDTSKENRTLMFEKINDKWNEIKSSKFPNLEKIVKKVDIEIFWQFYNSDNDPNYPEINKLKPLAKDANGVLNIEKLAKVIEENKAELSKYLDQ